MNYRNVIFSLGFFAVFSIFSTISLADENIVGSKNKLKGEKEILIDGGSSSDQRPAMRIEGETIDLVKLQYIPGESGKPMVLLFSDSLCPFHHLPNCEAELAAFNRMVETFGNQVQWLQVVKGYYTDIDSVKSYNRKFGLNIDTLWDQSNQVFKDYGVHANPYVVVIDNQGDIVYRKDDFVDDLSQVLSIIIE